MKRKCESSVCDKDAVYSLYVVEWRRHIRLCADHAWWLGEYYETGRRKPSCIFND